jgi:hypothetical protein
MISYETAKSIAVKGNDGKNMAASNRLQDGYLFSFIPKDLPEGEFFLGGYCKVTYNGSLEEYSPVCNPEEFKQALKNRIE